MFEPLRFWSMLGVLCAAAISLHLVSHGEPVMPSHSLANLPMALGSWTGRDLPIEQRILDAVGVDDHVSRAYFDQRNPPVLLYVGYYKSQRTGATTCVTSLRNTSLPSLTTAPSALLSRVRTGSRCGA